MEATRLQPLRRNLPQVSNHLPFGAPDYQIRQSRPRRARKFTRIGLQSHIVRYNLPFRQLFEVPLCVTVASTCSVHSIAFNSQNKLYRIPDSDGMRLVESNVFSSQGGSALVSFTP
jgi:hypothetical protein